jgi:hypothetical protein
MSSNSMSCERALRIVVNADTDIHDVALLQDARSHILHCPNCSAIEDDNAMAFTEDTLRTISIHDEHRAMKIVRLSLWLFGLAQLLVALPWVFGATPIWDPSNSAAESHLTRDGVIGVLFAFVAIAVATSPRLAFFAVPACVVLLSLQIVALIVDQQTDLVHVQFESIHLLTLVLTLLVIAMLVLPKWLARQGRNRKTQTRNTGEKRTLRSVR